MKKNNEKTITKSEIQTTRTHKTDKGAFLEQKLVDKKSGVLKKHTVLGPDGQKVQETIQVNNENALIIMTKLLSNMDMRLQNIEKKTMYVEKIYILMLEMNYYMAHLEPEDKRESKAIIKHFEKIGIKLNSLQEKSNG